MKKSVLFAAIMLLGSVQIVNAQNESNECGTLIVPVVYDYIEAGNDGLYVVGTLDKNGNGLGDKKGVIDSNGKVIVPINYQSIVLGKNEIDCGGLILVSNEVIVDDMYHSIYGLYNKDGVELVPMGKYRSISIKDHRGFNGLAIVWKGSERFIRYKDGTMSPSYDMISQEKSGAFSVRKDGLYGALNKNGEVIIPIKYDNISMKWDNGLIEVATYQNGTRKYGVYNDKGKVVVPIGKYESISIKESYIEVKKNKRKGILNSKGIEIVTPGMYEECYVRECHDRDQCYVAIKSYNKKEGAVNDDGKVFIPIGKYESFSVLNKNLALVKSNGKSGLLDKNGTMLVPIGKYDNLTYRYGVLTYSQNGKWGVLGEKGNPATPAEYDKIEPARHSKGMALVAKDSKIGVINSEGKMIMALGNYTNGSILGKIGFLTSNNGTLFFNLDGEILSPEGCYENCAQRHGKMIGYAINNWPVPLNPLKSEEGVYIVNSNEKYGVMKLW